MVHVPLQNRVHDELFGDGMPREFPGELDQVSQRDVPSCPSEKTEYLVRPARRGIFILCLDDILIDIPNSLVVTFHDIRNTRHCECLLIKSFENHNSCLCEDS